MQAPTRTSLRLLAPSSLCTHVATLARSSAHAPLSLVLLRSTTALLTDITCGRSYVNVHTATNGSGLVRAGYGPAGGAVRSAADNAAVGINCTAASSGGSGGGTVSGAAGTGVAALAALLSLAAALALQLAQ